MDNERGLEMARRCINHDITLIAFRTNEDGTMSVVDIVETSFHYASSFFNRYQRCAPDVTHVEVCRPDRRHGRRVAIRGI